MKAFMHQVEKQWRSQIGVKDVGGTGNGKVQTPDPTMFLRKQKDVTETEMEGLASNRRENSDPEKEMGHQAGSDPQQMLPGWKGCCEPANICLKPLVPYGPVH